MSSVTVECTPFREWLTDQIHTHGRQGFKDRCGIGGEAFLELERLVPGDHIPVKTVDRILVRMDTGTSLPMLYPDLDQPAGRTDLGRSYVCDEQLLIAAHTMHMDGMSVRAVAREIFDDCYSASPKALANALLGAWRGRGWEIRSQPEATALSNQQRGWRPQCSHISQASGRKGERCPRRCVGDDKTCWRHDPARISAGLARVRASAPGTPQQAVPS